MNGNADTHLLHLTEMFFFFHILPKKYVVFRENVICWVSSIGICTCRNVPRGNERKSVVSGWLTAIFSHISSKWTKINYFQSFLLSDFALSLHCSLLINLIPRSKFSVFRKESWAQSQNMFGFLYITSE